jgi:hypothetical protein
VKAYYSLHRVDSQLETLTKQMIQKAPGQPPKLRARGAEARGLVGFIREQTAEKFSEDVPIEAAAKHAASCLHAMYANLSQDAFSHASLAENSRKFALLWQSLEKATEDPFWRMKPKLHQMQELCEMSVHCPSKNWSYRDEDFGGFIASLVRIRGGAATAKRVGQVALAKFFARHVLPTM